MPDYPTRIVPVKLANGAIMHFEVSQLDPISAPQLQRERDVAGGWGDAGAESRERDVAQIVIPDAEFKNVMLSVEGIAQAVSETAERSNAFEVAVEFGLELAIENGTLTTLFVKGSGKANLKVALKWTRGEKTTMAPANPSAQTTPLPAEPKAKGPKTRGRA